MSGADDSSERVTRSDEYPILVGDAVIYCPMFHLARFRGEERSLARACPTLADDVQALGVYPSCVSMPLTEISGAGQAGWRVYHMETSGVSLRARPQHHPLPVHRPHLQ